MKGEQKNLRQKIIGIGDYQLSIQYRHHKISSIPIPKSMPIRAIFNSLTILKSEQCQHMVSQSISLQVKTLLQAQYQHTDTCGRYRKYRYFDKYWWILMIFYLIPNPTLRSATAKKLLFLWKIKHHAFVYFFLSATFVEYQSSSSKTCKGGNGKGNARTKHKKRGFGRNVWTDGWAREHVQVCAHCVQWYVTLNLLFFHL